MFIEMAKLLGLEKVAIKMAGYVKFKFADDFDIIFLLSCR